MENFIVSARKYRPVLFDTVVGQNSITRTLKNSIRNNHLAQAYLFCGPRGVGKTTCARIFAKTINCFNITDKIEACDTCESCKAFDRSTSYNIHELDAASNNSVDDIRNLIDQVRIPPQIGKYSIYIIDEVHMLSSQAFNAFLKTLEEPPAHAIFILATTEKHKIIPTILSRCQIFDFNRIKISDITNYLIHVAFQEKVEAEQEALNIIAQKADGAMRDALSIFDQLVSFAGTNITYRDVIDNLNVLDYDYYFRLVDHFLHGDISESLLLFSEILDEGFDPHHFINGLASHFRDLLVCKDEITLQLLEVGDSIRANYALQSKGCSQRFLFEALTICNNCDLNYRTALNKRLHVELSMVHLCYIDKTPSGDAEKVEKRERSVPVEKPAALTSVPVYAPKAEPVEKERKNIVPAEPIEVTKPKSAIYKKTLSIKDSLTSSVEKREKKEEVQADSVAHNGKREKAFSEEQLVQTWKDFSETILDKPRLYNTFVNQKPAKKENAEVELLLNNELQVNAIMEIRPALLNFLRNALENDTVELTLGVKVGGSEEKIYTDADKYNHLNKINPNLGKLKDQLNLDF